MRSLAWVHLTIMKVFNTIGIKLIALAHHIFTFHRIGVLKVQPLGRYATLDISFCNAKIKDAYPTVILQFRAIF